MNISSTFGRQFCWTESSADYDARNKRLYSLSFGYGAANATVNRELAALKRMFNLGARQTPPIVDRVPHIPSLKERNARKGFFEHWEFLSLREALPDYLKGFVTFAYKYGWRLEEITSLKWSQVDRNLGIVRTGSR